MKVVINREFGGFGLSDAAIKRYAEIAGINLVSRDGCSMFGGKFYYKDTITEENFFSVDDIPRNDPSLIQVVEELGKDVNIPYSCLKVIEIPDDVEWELHDYDGMEWIAEVHRTWR